MKYVLLKWPVKCNVAEIRMIYTENWIKKKKSILVWAIVIYVIKIT